MQINKDVLKSLNPCADRYKDYLKHNSDFSGSLNDFLDLPNLDYNDKLWVAGEILNKNQLVSWAILCVESVMYIFDANYPGNKSLSNCINYLKSIKDFDNLTNAQSLEIKRHLGIIRDYCTAHDDGADHAAAFAARSARYAAAAASNAAASATYASYAARSAANAAAFTDEDAAKHNQKELNIQFLKQVTSYS